MYPRVDIVGDEGVGELEHDIHLEIRVPRMTVVRFNSSEGAVLEELCCVGVCR